ncbi:MAG: KpsF/GutQ family sugar-phosphate isomerase [Coraliomargaritaceae bacterium]
MKTEFGCDHLSVGLRAMHAEANAISVAAARLGEPFQQAVEILLAAQSKLVICGIGKSGHVGGKLAATFSSCGLPSVFLHAAEAIHGDLGVYQPGDPTIVLSKSGSTAEVLRLIPVFRQFQSPIVAIVGNMDSPLAEAADVALDASVEGEADPLGLMPTSSSTVTLALGDALAAATVQARNFTKEQFAQFHPGGQLGRNLLLSVGEVMQAVERVATAQPEETLREVVIRMSEHPLGAACIIDPMGSLKGILTDGDIRRLLAEEDTILSREVGACMTPKPITIVAETKLGEALRIMEERTSQISVLPVVAAGSTKLEGLLRLHDAYQPSLL